MTDVYDCGSPRLVKGQLRCLRWACRRGASRPQRFPLVVGNGRGNDVACDPSGRAEGAQPGRRLFRGRWRSDLDNRLSLGRHQDCPRCAPHLGQEGETGGLEPGNRYLVVHRTLLTMIMDHRERPACSLATGFGDQRTARRRWPVPRSRRGAVPSGGRRRVRQQREKRRWAPGSSRAAVRCRISDHDRRAPLRALVGGALRGSRDVHRRRARCSLSHRGPGRWRRPRGRARRTAEPQSAPRRRDVISGETPRLPDGLPPADRRCHRRGALTWRHRAHDGDRRCDQPSGRLRRHRHEVTRVEFS